MGALSLTKFSSTDELAKIKDPSLVRSLCYIDGKWVKAVSQKTFAVTDPATLQDISTVPDMDASDVKAAVEAADRAFQTWKKTSAKQRSVLLRKWFDLIVENKGDLGRLMTLEGGKPLVEAEGEVAYGASFIEWFGEEAKRAYGDVVPSPMSATRIVVLKQPVGVVGIITPYNFPNAMITRKVGAALAAGCTVVVRPAHETPLSALALCELAERAGIPPGVINMVTSISHTQEVGLELTTNPAIRKVSFTGSTPVGKLLTGQAAGTMKKVSMELGGNAPFIVFDDADVDKAAENLVACKFRNSGQTCVCANRIYVHESIYEEFVQRFTRLVKEKLRIGHGLQEGVNFGPLITQRALEKVEDHLRRALDAGAKVAVGGRRPEGLEPGYFFEPTVLVDASDGVPMTCEETFGPLCAIYKFRTEEEVVRRANSVSVGLAGYFFSRDIGRVFRVAEALEVGMVGVNTGAISTEVAPFGGVKESGLGREGSRYGIDEYLNIKYLNLAL
ncbi:succinate semialdehyde dehydrogenase [Martensiomyces pterosporus]|nr:succinate semialdehyde dehydrogenase [Martensiomyces pterosporus]